MEIEQKLRNHIELLKKRKKELEDEVHTSSMKGQWITANQSDIKMRVIDFEIKDLTKLL
jgi:predicted ribosome quality control (RQC) complex YloA/Tae2 family protein